MLNQVLAGVFGSQNKRTIKRLAKYLNTIEQRSESLKLSQASDDELAAKFSHFQQRYKDGESLEDLLPEAFAVVREGGIRFLGMRHFDVQLLGGIALFEGNIAEMKTGEGKTLMATLPIYLKAIEGVGTHLVTVNEYLAKRDATWMGKLYRGLGMSVGVIHSDQPPQEKRQAYLADITYGTNNEFGFDYLRDNLALRLEDKVQRSLNFAIVDEVDSILIDEARTPLIISGPRDDSLELYQKIDLLIPPLKRQEVLEDGTVTKEGDFVLDEKMRSIEVTDRGHEILESEMIKMEILAKNQSLYDVENIHLLHHTQAALKAHHLFKRNVSYLVQQGKVVIVDEHTGRPMPGRRWSDGIHQAVEAKEGVEIQKENRTLASTTFQNYFRLYDTLSGMTGTADTEAYEFNQIYNLDVVVIPTHKEMIRKDMNDTVYMTSKEKLQAIVEDIQDCQKRGQPILVGTASVEASEVLSTKLTKSGITHNVLNAKNHAKEADIISDAGRVGALTIATNMAGRGTDIVLGGNLDRQIEALGEDATDEQVSALKEKWQEEHNKVLAAGGLHVIGAERHESRRIDNQLRGRSGRQGDPGSSHFYLSLEDDLLRLFTPEKVINMMRSLGLPEGEPIEHKMITTSIERAQRKVEGRNFDIRKQLLEYDDVANNQRLVIYEERNAIIEAENIHDAIKENLYEQVETLVEGAREESALLPDDAKKSLLNSFSTQFALNFAYNVDHNLLDVEKSNGEDPVTKIADEIYQSYSNKFEQFDDKVRDDLEKQIMLNVLDSLWRAHIQTMEYLRQGIHFRGYAQRNPKEEYKKEAYGMFDNLLSKIKQETVKVLCNLRINEPANGNQYADASMTSMGSMGSIKRSNQANGAAKNTKLSMNTKDRADSKIDPKIQDMAAASSGIGMTPPMALNPATTQRSTKQPNIGGGGGGSAQNFSKAKIGRNQPCPCGSGKKYKHCHGKTF